MYSRASVRACRRDLQLVVLLSELGVKWLRMA